MTHASSADVVVIGSGICGCLAAERLARTGRSVLILEAGPRVTREQMVVNYRDAARKGDWMAPYPPTPWAPHPVYEPTQGSRTDPDKGNTASSPAEEEAEGNGYLDQAGPYPYPAEYIRVVGGTAWH
ncbi:FAD-dependent oxidoreductase [Paracoccus sp. S-4012]|uniref:FAD-dependent oxidoreductase n=1 Tax=Paracoccus sp. S-4012 TaxID=2665648 RepID=UPI00351B1BCD